MIGRFESALSGLTVWAPIGGRIVLWLTLRQVVNGVGCRRGLRTSFVDHPTPWRNKPTAIGIVGLNRRRRRDDANYLSMIERPQRLDLFQNLVLLMTGKWDELDICVIARRRVAAFQLVDQAADYRQLGRVGLGDQATRLRVDRQPHIGRAGQHGLRYFQHHVGIGHGNGIHFDLGSTRQVGFGAAAVGSVENLLHGAQAPDGVGHHDLPGLRQRQNVSLKGALVFEHISNQIFGGLEVKFVDGKRHRYEIVLAMLFWALGIEIFRRNLLRGQAG